MSATCRGDAGFTLIELLVVICIIAILIALTTVALTVGLDTMRGNSTEAMLHDLSAAVASYQTKWGDFPPSSLDEIGVRAPNDVNTGIETLVVCLSSKRRGGPFFQKDDYLCNVDGDRLDRNPNDSYLAANELFEYKDHFGHVITYFHHKDYEKPKAGLTRYQLGAGGAEEKILPEVHPTSRAFVEAGRFQLRSVGKDGKPGSADDLRAGH